MKSSGQALGAARRLLPAMLVTGAVLLAGAPASAAASANDPAVWPITACPVGSVLYLPSSTTIEDDGWIRLDYDIDGGHGFEEFPPAGFRPVQARTEELARHHLQVRPQAPGDLALWTSQWGRATWVRTQGACMGGGLPSTSYSKTQPLCADEARAAVLDPILGGLKQSVSRPWGWLLC